MSSATTLSGRQANPAGRPSAAGGRAGPLVVALLGLGLTAAVPPAAGRLLESAPAGRVEAGTPDFVITGMEALGLDSAPTDLHALPDGRLLVVAPRQLALGDGTRWSVRQQSPDEVVRLGCAVDDEGGIYFGTPGGFGRVRFAESGFWRVELAARWPVEESPDRIVPYRQVTVGTDWLWHSESGTILSWQPGQPARVVGRLESIGHLFGFRGQLYASELSSGRLLRLERGQAADVLPPVDVTIKDAVTSAVPLGRGMLLGTEGRGLVFFDGETVRPFVAHGVLADTTRINDLTLVAGGLLAAAVENFGVIFFDSAGRVVQVLERSLDHRLSHVTRLVPFGGSIWGLAGGGLLRIEFPSRVSNFEPLVSVGVVSPLVLRHRGDLWICSNEQLLRAVYADDGRMMRLEPDGPAGRNVRACTTVGDRLVAGTDRGAFFREESGWVPFAGDTKSLRVLSPSPVDGRYLYGAQGEIGWMRPTAGGFELERLPHPELGHIHASVTDRSGRIWLELGLGRLGRIELRPGRPVLEILGAAEGLPNSWAMAYEVDGNVGFNVANQWLKFDEVAQRFVPDTGFVRMLGRLADAGGRSVRDARGRIWVTGKDGPQLVEDGPGGGRAVGERMPPGLRPWAYVPEENGVVWMIGDRHLSRFDPALPAPAPPTLRAVITQVTLPASNRRLLSPGDALPPLDYADNSLVVHFVAPGNPFATPVLFSVKLEGLDAGWSEVGSGGSAVFNRLAEGRYVLHVLPSAAGLKGTESTLAFTVRPPLFRTPLALALYVVAAAGLFGLSLWGVSYFSRREQLRLERLVEERTARLRASEARLQLEFELMPIGCIVWDPGLRVQKWNPKAEHIFGYSPDEAVGRPAGDLIVPGGARAEGDAFWLSGADPGRNSHHTSRNRTKDGKLIWCEWTNAPLKDASGAVLGVMSMVEDVSARRAMEDHLRQTQKMEVIGLLAGGIAHDFNNILTGIVGNTEFAQMDLPPDHPVQATLGRVFQAAQRARNLVNQILAFSRQQEHERSPLLLPAVVSEAMELLRPSLPSTIRIQTEFAAGLPAVMADSSQIHQVLMNLAANSANAIGEAGGTIEIRLDAVEFDDAAVRQRPQLRRGRFVRMAVGDTGCGMDARVLEHIFEPFFTTRKRGAGTGLGLSVVHGIVQQHDGFITVSSEPGRGTTFHVYLPACAAPGAAAAPAGSAPTRMGAGQQIMVVDDEEMVLRVAAGILGRLNYRCTTFSDPEAALAAFGAEPRQYELVVTDLTMPTMKGTELAERLHRIRPDVPVVLATGFSGTVDDAEFARLNLRGPLLKPFTLEMVSRLIAESLNSAGAAPGGEGHGRG